MVVFLVLVIYLGIVIGQSTPSGSVNCGNLISKDGYRYDLTPLRDEIARGNYTSGDGYNATVMFTVCNNPFQCGSCYQSNAAGVCLLPQTCAGSFSINYVDPLLYGIGVGLRYYGGSTGQASTAIATYLTVFCDPGTPGISSIVIDGEQPLLSIRMKSSAGCPAHGGYPPSLPFQYNFKKYIYTVNPANGVTQQPFVLDKLNQWKRNQDVILDSSTTEQKYFYIADFDQYHNLSCYYINTTDAAAPFSLPENASYLGELTESIYDPVSNSFKNVLTDKWRYTIDDTCAIIYWFLSGKAVPIQEKDCSGKTIIYYDFELGQPHGSYYNVPSKCYPFQTCGPNWNTCKDPYCCNSAGNSCVPCDSK